MPSNVGRLSESREQDLGGEDGEGHKGAEESEGDPVGGKLADAKVEHQQLQLGHEGEAGVPDVARAAPPQLHWTARPAVLLLPEGEEAGGELRRTHTARSAPLSILGLADYDHRKAIRERTAVGCVENMLCASSCTSQVVETSHCKVRRETRAR